MDSFAGVNLIKFGPYFSDRWPSLLIRLGLMESREGPTNTGSHAIAVKYLDQACFCWEAPSWLMCRT